MRRNLNRLYAENEVTYKGVIAIAVALQIVSFYVRQILQDLDIRLPSLPNVGNLDFTTLLGLTAGVASTVFAFWQIRMADAGDRDTRQQAIKNEILREVDEGKQLTNKLIDKISDLEKDLFAQNIGLDTHIKSELHPGALKKLSNLEDKVYEARAAIAILNRDAELSFRLSKLEQFIETLANNNQD